MYIIASSLEHECTSRFSIYVAYFSLIQIFTFFGEIHTQFLAREYLSSISGRSSGFSPYTFTDPIPNNAPSPKSSKAVQYQLPPMLDNVLLRLRYDFAEG